MSDEHRAWTFGEKINTSASIVAALTGVGGILIAYWSMGADDRKIVLFRDQCRSEIGSAFDLLRRSSNRASYRNTMQRIFLQRDWLLLEHRFEGLRNAAPQVAPDDVQLLTGLTDAGDLAQRWSERTDFWNGMLPGPGNEKVFDDELNQMLQLSEQILIVDAGEVR